MREPTKADEPMAYRDPGPTMTTDNSGGFVPDGGAELRRELKALIDKYGLWAVAYCLQHPDE